MLGTTSICWSAADGPGVRRRLLTGDTAPSRLGREHPQSVPRATDGQKAVMLATHRPTDRHPVSALPGLRPWNLAGLRPGGNGYASLATSSTSARLSVWPSPGSARPPSDADRAACFLGRAI